MQGFERVEGFEVEDGSDGLGAVQEALADHSVAPQDGNLHEL
jgi:hypothetical protein